MRHFPGFTLIEMLLVVVFFLSLATAAGVNLVGRQRTTSLATISLVLATDVKSQQLKAMLGDTEGRAAADVYGVHFDSDKYVLFHGSVYQPGNAENFSVTLPVDLQFTAISLPSSNIIFTKGSGEVSGYASASASVALQNSTDFRFITFRVNRYGTLIQNN